jgi:membrane protein
VPLILAWLYACWAILLLGAEVAFAAQNLPYARREMRNGEASPAMREAIAVEVAVEIVRHFRDQQAPPTTESLADELDEPVRLVRQLVDAFENADLVRSVLSRDDEEIAYVPARPIRELTVGEVLRAVRGELEPEPARSQARSPLVEATMGRLKGAWSDVADQTSLETLARPTEGAVSGAGA